MFSALVPTIFLLSPLSHAFFLDGFLFWQQPEPCFPGECVNCLTCWLAGGARMTGKCSGFFEVCCQPPAPTAEARKLTFSPADAANELDQHLQDIQYGEVLNEPACGKSQIAR